MSVLGSGRSLRFSSPCAEDAWGGSAGGMVDYEEGLRATRRLLKLLAARELADFLAVDLLRSIACDDLAWMSDSHDPRRTRARRRRGRADLDPATR